MTTSLDYQTEGGKKMGNKKKQIQRYFDEKVCTYITSEDYELLKEYAILNGFKVSELLRRMIIVELKKYRRSKLASQENQT
jgi:hypothetical protein